MHSFCFQCRRAHNTLQHQINVVFPTDHYLEKPVKVLTMLTNDAEYEDGLKYFKDSFSQTRNIDTPMELEVIRVSSEKFFELGWRAKIVYALKSLRYEQCDPLHYGVPEHALQETFFSGATSQSPPSAQLSWCPRDS